MKTAIIDLGTNTFHLLIAENGIKIYEDSIAAKIGIGGIQDNIITEEAQERALNVLTVFSEKIIEYEVGKKYAFGTSAIRNAENRLVFLEKVKSKLDIDIQILDGIEEADLIYRGVKKALNIDETSLIVDIGGGSVEFIIANAEKILWLKSFEMGGLRLMEKFMKKDPINTAEIPRMNEYFRQTLLPLANAIHQYHPKILIGSSGSFDTLNDMLYSKQMGHFAPKDIAGFDYPILEFWKAYESLVFNGKKARLAIEGMIALRVEMIVVSVILIKFLIETFGIEQIKISNYALKEGALSKLTTENAQ